MRKKIISIVLGIMLMFNFISVQYARANEATEVLKAVSVNGAALGATALGGAVALLAVLGVYVASENDAVRKAAVDFYNYCDETNKQAIRTMRGDYALVSNALYEKAQSFVNATYSLGNSIRRSIDFVIGADGTVVPSTVGVNGYTLPSGISLISTDGRFVTFFSGGDITYDVTERYAKEDDLPVTIGPMTSCYNFVHSQKYVNGVLCDVIITHYYFDIYNNIGERINGNQCIPPPVYLPVGSALPDVSVPVMEEADYYDYTRSGVSVPLPQTATGDRVIAVPQTLGLEGVEVTGDMCVPVANAIPAEIADTIVEYPETEEPTEDLPRVDFPKMAIPPKLGLTRKFPFSIPWDLKNAVTSLVAERKCPRFEIDFDSAHFVGGGKVVLDFEQFEVWAKIIRWGELIAFNIVLIKITRKIIGA